MQVLLAGFLEYQEHVRHASPHTLRCYKADLERFISGMEDPTVAGFGRLAVRSFLGTRHGKIAASSLQRAFYAVRSFGAWAFRMGKLEADPTEGMRPPKAESLLPEVLSLDEVFRLLAVPDPLTPRGARDRAILELLYATGCRCSELAGLDLADADPAGGTFRVRHGKGDRDRFVVAGTLAVESLRTYLWWRPCLVSRRRGRDPKAVFLSWMGTRLTARNVQRILNQAGQGAGLGEVHPHMLRHACGTHLLDQGAGLRIVQEQLGHATISATQRYTSVSAERIAAVIQDCHPRARLPKSPPPPDQRAPLGAAPLYRRRKKRADP